jgi:hypothetical protein
MMRLAGKAERGQGAHGNHQTNRDRGSEMQMWRQLHLLEKKRGRASSLPAPLLEAVLEIAF